MSKKETKKEEERKPFTKRIQNLVEDTAIISSTLALAYGLKQASNYYNRIVSTDPTIRNNPDYSETRIINNQMVDLFKVPDPKSGDKQPAFRRNIHFTRNFTQQADMGSNIISSALNQASASLATSAIS